MFMKHDRLNPVLSDASGNYGCGAFSGSRWFKFGWEPGMEELHVMISQLCLQLQSGSVQCRCDNEVVVHIMHVSDASGILVSKFDCMMSASHIKVSTTV